MKDRILTYLSLTLSAAAMAYSAWVHQNTDRTAVEALRQRELEFVRAYAPKMEAMYAAMIEDPTEAFPSPPQTIEELFKPITDMIAKFEGPDLPDSPTHRSKIPDEIPR